jgi:hypothetical protein
MPSPPGAQLGASAPPSAPEPLPELLPEVDPLLSAVDPLLDVVLLDPALLLDVVLEGLDDPWLDPVLVFDPAHAPSLQVRPLSHVVPLQHGSPAVPQLRHMAAVPHVSPLLQALGLQQGSPAVPQVPPSGPVPLLSPLKLAQLAASPPPAINAANQASARVMDSGPQFVSPSIPRARAGSTTVRPMDFA